MEAEWTKIRSVRATVWTLAAFVVVSLGLTGLFTWLTLNALNNGRSDARGSGIVTDPVNFILGTGLGLGQLAILVLGALVITSEYSSGAKHQPGQLLSPWQGFGVFCAWTALLLAAASYLVQRRDA